MKNISTIIILLLYLLNSYSQSIDEAFKLYNAGQYEQAAAEFEKMLPLIEKEYGSNDTSNYSPLLFYTALSFYRCQQYIIAEKYFLYAKKIFEQNHAILNDWYHSTLNNLALLYQDIGNYEKAEPLYLQALEISKKIHSTETPFYITSLNNLGVLYFDIGNYVKAESILLKVVEIKKKVLGEDHPDYVTSLNNLARLYQGMGIFEKAECLYLEALEIGKIVLGEEHPNYITSKNNLAVLYQDIGNYEKAELMYLQVLEIRKKILSEGHPDYAISLNNLALLYQDIGNYEKAESLYLQALEIIKKVFGEEHPDYATFINNLGLLNYDIGNFYKADSLFLRALEIKKKVLGEEHPDYATSLNNLAGLYQKMGNIEKAELLLLQTLEIRKKVLGEENPDYVTPLHNLALLYHGMGNYEKAEPLYLHSLEISKKILGEKHPDYAISLNTLAQLYHEMGNYERAESLFLQALEINKKVFGEEHPAYAVTLNNLALLYQDMGNYEKAEHLYIQALEINKKVFGGEHPDYATFLNNFAIFYQNMGNYEKAEHLCLQALEINKKVFGEEHPAYATSLNNLANLCQTMGILEKLEFIYLQALVINKKVFGEEHPNYITILNNLAGLYRKIGNYEKAEPLYLRVLELRKKVLGEEHPDYATTLNSIAVLYQNMGNYEKAEPLYLHALEIKKKIFGEEHPDYTVTLNNLALLYQDMGNYEKAEPIFIKAINTNFTQIRQQFIFLSEIEKEKYMTTVFSFFSIYQNFILQQQSYNPAITKNAYDIEVTNKGMILNACKQMRISILSSGDSIAIKTYNSWIAVRASLARQYSLPFAQQTLDTRILVEQANKLEKQLTKLSSVNNNLIGLHSIHWEDIQKQLNPNDVAIEFTHFPFYNGKQWTDSTIYVALLLKKDDVYPKMVPLFEDKQLDSLLNRGTGSSSSFINNLYRWAINDNQSNSGKGQLLYNLVWKPLEKYMDGVQTIYYSPSGQLQQLSFAAIPCGETELLSDKYRLYQLSSTAQLTIKYQEKTIKEMVLYGGIDYDTPLDQLQSDANKYRQSKEEFTFQASRSISQEDIRSGSWSYLNGTLTEVEKIRKLAEDKGINTSMITGNEAIEESIKYLYGDKSPYVIHIATHGFFFPDPEKKYDQIGLLATGENDIQPYKLSDNPLMRSGLIFAGANHAWSGEDVPLELDDGILTAYEVSNMYLPNTELVVLSACETGLGEIKGSEGVYGLQRSFKIAGTEYILMSLWQIPDYQTSELMNHFYIEWLSGKPIQESFNIAQDFMKNKYSGQPFMWAGFVLVR